MTQVSTTTSPPATTHRPTGALACCGIAAVVVTLLALLVSGGAMAWLGSGGTAADRSMATLLVVIGLAFLATPAVLMWVALVQLATQPPRGAKLMIWCLRAVGGFFLAVVLPTVSRGGSIAVMGAVVGIALAFLGTARLVSTATRSAA